MQLEAVVKANDVVSDIVYGLKVTCIVLPRKTLGWKTPAEPLNALLSDARLTGVATTP